MPLNGYNPKSIFYEVLMEHDKNVEIIEEENIEEKPAEKKGLAKVKEFFQKPIVKKIVGGIVIAGATIIGYTVGAVTGSKNDGSCEDAGYLPEPGCDDGNETDDESEDCTDYADNGNVEE
jgi:hypothetical protein